jgi:hypothetical protein
MVEREARKGSWSVVRGKCASEEVGTRGGDEASSQAERVEGEGIVSLFGALLSRHCDCAFYIHSERPDLKPFAI